MNKTAQEQYEYLKSIELKVDEEMLNLMRITRYCPTCNKHYFKDEFATEVRSVKAEICVDTYEQEYEVETIDVRFYICPFGHEQPSNIGRYHLL